MNFSISTVFFILLLLITSVAGKCQTIFAPEGLNIPGTWDAFMNPPDKSVFRMANPPGTDVEVPCGTDFPGGAVNLFNNLYPAGQLASTIYRTSFAAADAGPAGSYNFLFTSGPCTDFFRNKWSRSNIAFTGVAALMNTVETYYYCNTVGSGNPNGCVDWGNTDIVIASGKYYTVNYIDNGYVNASAIFFETSTAPVTINSVTAAYDNTAAGCNGGAGLAIAVTCSGKPSAEEKLYIRYAATPDFSTSLFAPVVFADTTQLSTGKAIIPFAAATTYYYYALSSTLTPSAIAAYNTSATTDMVTLMANTNNGANYNYTFSVSAALNTLNGYYLVDNTAGTYFPNSFAFLTIADAVTAINSNGVCGHVVVQVKGGYTETTPTGGLLLKYAAGVPVSAPAKSVTFRKMGSAGNHPLITAWNNSAGTITAGSASTGDGIFKIAGCDNITIEHIDLQENTLNTAAGPWMEYGFALLKESAVNGAQYCTITGCNIQLNRLNNTSSGSTANESGSTGIALLNITTTSSSSVVVTNSTGSNSNNRLTANTIGNVFNGIVIKGYNAASPYSLFDQQNNVGGSNASSGNSISNFGGSGSVQSYGIYLIYQNKDSIRFNDINNLNNGGVAHTHILYGIFHSTATNASVYIGNNSISVAKSNSSNDLVAVRSSLSGTGRLDVIGNTITACSSGGGSGAFYGIYSSAAPATENINGNFIINNTTVNTTGNAYLIYTYVVTNTFIAVSDNTISSFTKTGAGNSIYCYYNATGGSGGSETISSNTFTDITGTGATHVYGIYSFTNFFTSQDAFITDNVIAGLTTNGTSATNLMGINYQKNSNSKSVVISGNSVSDLSGGASITGIFGSVSGTGSNAVTLLSNQIQGLVSTVGDVFGIQGNNSDLIIGLNIIGNLETNASKTIRGIYFLGFQDVQCYRNRIYDFVAYGTSGIAYGIYDDNTASDHDCYNNIVGDLHAPESNLANAVACFISGVNMSPPIRLYNNTFYLNTSSTGTNFGSAAVYINTNGFANTLLYLKNNIMVNLSVANGTGITAAFKTTNANYSTYMTSSNNNLFYAGTPSASNVLFFNGSTGYQTMAAFKAAVGPLRESNSDSAMPDFLNAVDGTAADYLHIDESGPNVDYVDMKALPIIGEVGIYGNVLTISIDYDAEARNSVMPDVGADEIIQIILPVTLLDFETALSGSEVRLSWNTAAEYGSAYFVIESCTDGVHFEEIGLVDAAGFSMLPLHYFYTDTGAADRGVARIYYRLRMVDTDHSFQYTTVRWVDLDDTAVTENIIIFPNPVKDLLSVKLYSATEQFATIELTEVTGKLIRRENTLLNQGYNFLEMNRFDELADGIYLLKVTSGRNYYTRKVVKE